METEKIDTKVFFEDEPVEIENELDLVRLTRSGISKKSLLNLIEFSGISITEMGEILPISLRTIQRYGKDDKFPTYVSDHILSIIKLVYRGVEIFGDEKKFSEWLRSPLLALDNQTPLSLLDTNPGMEMVSDVLTRLEYGVYS